MKALPTKHQKQEKQEVAPPDDEDKVLYDDDDDSLPDPFGSQEIKKLKKSDTKEVRGKEKATSMSEAMDTSDMPQLISDDEDEQSKVHNSETSIKETMKITFCLLCFKSIKIQNLFGSK